MPVYHMHKKEREIQDPQEIRRILKSGKYATLSLCRDNEPYLVTLNYGWDAGTESLYFHSAKSGLKMEFLKQNPRVCGTVIEDRGYLEGRCSHAYRSVVFIGNLSSVEDLEGKKFGMNILLNHLETDPDPIRKRTLDSDEAYERVAILKLQIHKITGKQAH